ncbi:MAG: ATP-binding protein [Treponema sp.]|nr:ATP-binding protein [Treponema sp.]
MLTNLEINNFCIYSKPVGFSMEADMRSKRLAPNVHQEAGWNILKSAAIFGANNSGKTCLIKAIRVFRGLIMDQPTEISANLFSGNPDVTLAVTFLEQGSVWRFAVKLNTRGILYEEFAEITKDLYSNKAKKIVYKRDFENSSFECQLQEITPILKILSRSNILINVVDTTQFTLLSKVRRTLRNFANSIVIIDMNNIPILKTISAIKNHTKDEEQIKNFIRQADLDLEDVTYSEDMRLEANPMNSPINPAEEILIRQSLEDQLRLTSVYHGIKVRSFQYDSTGTKKIIAVASYIIEALRTNKILVIDELDSSLHFKLTRAMVNLFNNEKNDKAQLIFTLHDISLLDCKRLFRKEQIWFVNKYEKGADLYSLSKFTAADDGVRDTSDIIEKYKKGLLISLPEPNLLDVLLEAADGK